jgi:uncharacterized membrane protein YdjX (TVP38/TMEM64 family)
MRGIGREGTMAAYDYDLGILGGGAAGLTAAAGSAQFGAKTILRGGRGDPRLPDPCGDLEEGRRMKSRKILILIAFAAVVAAFHFLDLGKYLTLESLKANRGRLTDLRAAHAFLLAAVFVLIYVVQTAFSLPGAAILSLAAGAIFGVLLGALFVVSGATVGAILAFLVSRTLLRDWVVKKFGGRMEGIDRGLRENGLSYLLFLRLVPAFPFFLVNLACGVTGLPLRTYALGTLFGIMPGSLVFVNAGASLAAIETVSQVASPRVLGSFALLGLFALLPTIINAVKKRREGSALPFDRRLK